MKSGYILVIQSIIVALIDASILVKAVKSKYSNASRKTFIMFAASTVFMQVVVAFSQCMEYQLFEIDGLLPYFVFNLVMFTVCISSYAWMEYLYISLLSDNGMTLGRRIGHLIPSVLLLVLGLGTRWTKLVFYFEEVDGKHLFKSGPLYAVRAICPYSYYVGGAFIFLIWLRKQNFNANKWHIRNFSMFLIPALIGGVMDLYTVTGYAQIGISLGMMLMFLEIYIEESKKAERQAGMEEIHNRLQEVNDNLLQRLSIISSMSKVYFTSFYADLEQNTFEELSNIELVRNQIGARGNLAAAFETFCNDMIKEPYKEEMRRFVDLSTLDERMAGKMVITQDYEGVVEGWCRVHIIEGIREADGSLRTIFVATRKIHEEKQREEEHNRSIREAQIAAENANSAKTTFLFNMSHDIRTPMNAIMGFTELLEQGQQDEETRLNYIRKIKESGLLLLGIINNVLEMARIEKGTIEVREDVCSFSGFTGTLKRMFDELMTQKKVTFVTTSDIRHQYVYCDESKMREVYLNILSNALKYTPEGGTVLFSQVELPYDKPGYAKYRTTISDTGLGMSQEYLAHVFEEFSRETNSSANRIEGTGLGMSIVKRLLEVMDGTIQIESEKDKGTTVIVEIEHRIADASEMTEQPKVEIDPEGFVGKRILLAEDNDLNAEIAEAMLVKEGFEVERATDGRDCIDKLTEARVGYYDLILMDIQMPRMGGYEATKKIRELKDPTLSSIPIIAMTANAFEEDKRKAFDAGMNGHLGKPINPKEVMMEIGYTLKV